MEVILKEDINNLGHRGDVVKVADGYGRNFLLPKKLAMEATAANKAVIEQMKHRLCAARRRRSPRRRHWWASSTRSRWSSSARWASTISSSARSLRPISRRTREQGLQHRPPQGASGRAAQAARRVPYPGQAAPRSDGACRGHGQGRRSRSLVSVAPKLVPQGRLNLAQDASPGLDLKGRPVPQGRLKIGRDAILDNLQPSLRDLIMLHDVPRTSVLG